MSAIPPIAPLASLAPPESAALIEASSPKGTGFAELLAKGVAGMEAKVAQADELVRRFAIDGNVPVHQVTFALEEARLSIELAMQVRARLTEAYRDLMNMQL